MIAFRCDAGEEMNTGLCLQSGLSGLNLVLLVCCWVTLAFVGLPHFINRVMCARPYRNGFAAVQQHLAG